MCTKEEREKINRGSNKGEQLKAELLGRVWKGFDSISNNLNSLKLDVKFDDEKLKQAVAHKEKLIDYDRTRWIFKNSFKLKKYFLILNPKFQSAKRTQVIDDESDYFNTNSKWLSEQQRILLEVLLLFAIFCFIF